MTKQTVDRLYAKFAGLRTCSWKLLLVNSLRSSKDENQSLVSEDTASELQDAVLREVQERQPMAPSEEWDLLRVYLLAAERLREEYRPPRLEDSDAVRALFNSALSVNRSQSMGSRAMNTVQVLAWEPLIVVLGSEHAIRDSIDLLRDIDTDEELVQIVDKYLDGWRPPKQENFDV